MTVNPAVLRLAQHPKPFRPMSVSILILTKNEESELPGCLRSVRWSDDVHLMDAFSTDRTRWIAEKFGAMVTQREFDNHASQLNAALNGIPFKYPWLLLLKADERVTAGLEAELRLMMYHTGPEMAYFIRRREFAQGQRRRDCPASLHLRYFSWDAVCYEGKDQALAVVDGPVGELEAPFDHAVRATDHDGCVAPRYRDSRSSRVGVRWLSLLRFAHGFRARAIPS